MQLIALAGEAAHHAESLWPELAGGFVGYWVHVTHHRLYHLILKLIPGRLQR